MASIEEPNAEATEAVPAGAAVEEAPIETAPSVQEAPIPQESAVQTDTQLATPEEKAPS
jgi:hypothetical protein